MPPVTPGSVVQEVDRDLMRQTVHRYGGMVNIVTGEGIVVVFGAPVALEDHLQAWRFGRQCSEAVMARMIRKALSSWFVPA